MTAGAFQTGPNSGLSGFVSKLNSTGSALSYSTFVGPASGTSVYAIAVDSAGCAYITGQASGNIPTSTKAIQPQPKGLDAFVIKLNATGTAEVYGTYLGGSNNDQGNGIAVDSSGDAYIAGVTYSTDFPTQSPIQSSQTITSKSGSGFLAQLNADASALLYSTYLGGAGGAVANGIAVDGSGNAFVTGQTTVPSSGLDTFPLLDPLQAIASVGAHAFLTKFSSAGALVYSTYLGGSGQDSGSGVAVDGAGNAYVTGSTTSYDFPVVNVLQSNLGGYDSIAVKSLDGGNTWSAGHAGEFTGVVNALVVNPATPSTIFAGMASGRAYQSIDGGAHWSRSDSGLPGVAVSSLAIAANGSAIYAGTAAGVFGSTDGGGTWFAQNSGLTNTTVNAIAVDPSSASILYAATGDSIGGATGGALFMSSNGGGSWTAVGSRSGSYYTSLAIDPVTPLHVYSGTSNGYLFYSLDRFATSGTQMSVWTNSVNRVNALAMDTAGTLYVAAAGPGTTLPWPDAGHEPTLLKMTGLGSGGFVVTSIVDAAGEAGLSVAVSSAGTVYAGMFGLHLWHRQHRRPVRSVPSDCNRSFQRQHAVPGQRRSNARRVFRRYESHGHRITYIHLSGRVLLRRCFGPGRGYQWKRVGRRHNQLRGFHRDCRRQPVGDCRRVGRLRTQIFPSRPHAQHRRIAHSKLHPDRRARPTR